MEQTNGRTRTLTTRNDLDKSPQKPDLAIGLLANWQNEAGTLEPTVGGSCSNCSNCCGDSAGF